VAAVPGTLRTGGVPFGTTHWSVIAACANDEHPGGAAGAALAQLCRDYWPPLYSFVRRRGYNSADAQDLVQGFFAYFLKSRAYEQTDRRKGKFRSFLLASIKHYMADVWDRERALKRGGGCEFVLLDEEIRAAETQWSRAPSSAAMEEDRHYEHRWADALVTRALTRLEHELTNEAKRNLFCELKPFLCGGAGLPKQEEVATRLRIPIETLRSHLSRLRSRYRALLRGEVARTVSEIDDVDEELRHLCNVLAAAC
jgi:RNA polymerase sigma factor (sigma-70 family)